MKFTLSYLFATGILFIFSISNGNAQRVRKEMVSNIIKSYPDSAAIKRFPGHIDGNSTYLNNISVRATRDFEQKFTNATDAEWFIMTTGYIVKFAVNGIKHKMAYDTRGNWVYTIKFYGEKKLPHEVRAIIKATYYDYTITQVEEIEQASNKDNIVYLVHMYDDTTWKNIIVCNGEMQVIEDYKKG